MSHDYFARSMRALQLGGMSERTQEAYTRSVRMLVEFYGKPPEQITEVELEEYFLHRRNVDNWSAATLRIVWALTLSGLFVKFSEDLAMPPR